MRLFSGFTACLLAGAFLVAPPAGANSRTEITFTADQVERGARTYREYCQICHGTTLANGQFGTPLKGSFFRNNWSGKTLGELVKYTYETMPPDNVMLFPPQGYADVVAFILEANDLEPGDAEMSGDFTSLGEVPLPW